MEEYYTILGMAEKLHIHPNTIRKMIKDGRLTALIFESPKRKMYRIPKFEVDRLYMMNLNKEFK